jgi:hypothetical protein
MASVEPSRAEAGWTFEPPREARVKGYCPSCRESVALQRPRLASLARTHYVIEAQCNDCQATVVLTLS